MKSKNIKELLTTCSRFAKYDLSILPKTPRFTTHLELLHLQIDDALSKDETQINNDDIDIVIHHLKKCKQFTQEHVDKPDTYLKNVYNVIDDLCDQLHAHRK